jgi:hypothetical protein
MSQELEFLVEQQRSNEAFKSYVRQSGINLIHDDRSENHILLRISFSSLDRFI